MRTIHYVAAAALPIVLLAGCQSTRERVPAERYSSAEHERTLVNEMNINRPGKIGEAAASEQDNRALRESLSTHPHRSMQSQAAGATTNEMPEGKALPRLSDESMKGPTAAVPTEQPTFIEERTIVIVPAETQEEAMMRRNRESEDIALRQQAQAEQGAEMETAKIGDVMEYEPDFRKNYDSRYADSGYAYEQYRPAYVYGYELAKDPNYRSVRDWSELEPRIRGDWNESTMGPWDRYKDAVRYAWERVREGQG